MTAIYHDAALTDDERREQLFDGELRHYLRASDLSHVPDDLVEAYDDETHERGELVYEGQR